MSSLVKKKGRVIGMCGSRVHYEWIILGKFRCEDKFHCVDGGVLGTKFKSYEEAYRRMIDLKNQESRRRISCQKNREYIRMSDGITAAIEYYSDYDIVDWKIRERQVTDWYDVE